MGHRGCLWSRSMIGVRGCMVPMASRCGDGGDAIGNTGRMRRARRDPPLVAAAREAGVDDPRVLAAVARVPRASFVPEDQRRSADTDRPLPIGDGQTTSQPSLIAAMVAALELSGDERVLEVGTGYGYQTAILTHLAAEVFSVERFVSLARRARANLAAAGMIRWHVEVGDGTQGLPMFAPYDAIIVSAAASELPESFAAQLRDGGRLVAPVGETDAAQVVVYQARRGRLHPVSRLMGVRFVPLVAGDINDVEAPSTRDASENGGDRR